MFWPQVYLAFIGMFMSANFRGWNVSAQEVRTHSGPYTRAELQRRIN